MIVFCHLLNDHSGSPRILASSISALSSNNEPAMLLLGSDGSGLLDNAGIPIQKYWYKRTPYRLLTLLTYVFSQLALFAKLIKSSQIPKAAVIYVNTLLPFGAAVYGKLTGRRVIYHLHEVSVSPAPLRWLLTGVARWTAYRLIYVSNFHRECLPPKSASAVTVYNSLDNKFLSRAQNAHYAPRRNGVFRVLMLGSLRDYKGIPEFLNLARSDLFSEVAFDFVANAERVDIERYFARRSIPANVTIHSRTDDTAAFYSRASVLLNLSRPDQWIETFGLTVLEAMAFGVPVIAPPVGGPAELITDGEQGYLIDSRASEQLALRLAQLVADESLCFQMSSAARLRASCFTFQNFSRGLKNALSDGDRSLRNK